MLNLVGRVKRSFEFHKAQWIVFMVMRVWYSFYTQKRFKFENMRQGSSIPKGCFRRGARLNSSALECLFLLFGLQAWIPRHRAAMSDGCLGAKLFASASRHLTRDPHNCLNFLYSLFVVYFCETKGDNV